MYGDMRHDLAVPGVDINCSMHGWDGNEAREDTPREQGTSGGERRVEITALASGRLRDSLTA